MIHGRIINYSSIKKIIAVILIMGVAVAGGIVISKKLDLLEKACELANLDGMLDINDDICMTLVNKALPVVYISTGEEDEPWSLPFTAQHLFKYITSIDYNNPRQYLESQIPLLGMLEANASTLSATSESFSSGVIDANGEDTTKTVPPSSNDVPAVNTTVDASKPAVIIYHTHTTESFTPTLGDEKYRTDDNNYNVCRVGEEIKKYIETNYGLAVIHDTTVHDKPYLNSYSRSRVTIQNLVKKYPGAKIIIDLHRDANVDRKSIVASIGEEKAARVMIIVDKGNPYWQENYQLIHKLDQKMEELYPGLVRKVSFKNSSHYNQDVSNRSMLIEIGKSLGLYSLGSIDYKQCAFTSFKTSGNFIVKIYVAWSIY